MIRDMRILVYKRTHAGDPDLNGVFGHRTCMGAVRDRHYDAAIGIGGSRPWPGDEEIACKVNWIGIGKQPMPSSEWGVTDGGHTVVGFEHFLLLDGQGPKLKDSYKLLYQHMILVNRRAIMSDSVDDDLYIELKSILRLAANAPRSPGLLRFQSKPVHSNCGNRTEVFK